MSNRYVLMNERALPMRFFFDESGDFSYPSASYDCYVIVGLVCPDSVLPKIEALVDRLKSAFGVEELHAVEINEEQRLAFAIGLSSLDIRFVAFATDTQLDSQASIEAFRFAQAQRYQEGADRYVRETEEIGLTPDAQIAEFTEQAVKRAGYASRVPSSELVQTHFTLELLHESLQCSLIAYMEDRWRADFEEMRFELDGKLRGKLSSGEKLLDAVLLPSLGSRPHRSLIVVDTWKDSRHPFILNYEVRDVRVGGVAAEGGFDLRKVFEHGLSFVDSAESAGVQAADLIASSLRRAVLEPESRNARLVVDRLLPLAFNEADTVGARVVRLGPSDDVKQDLSRFGAIARSRVTDTTE